MWQRLTATLLVTAAALLLGSGAAAGLGITATRLGSGSANVSACGSSNFTFQYTIDVSELITSVDVGNIPLSCAGGRLRIALVNGVTSVGSGSVTLPTSGFAGSATVSLNPTPIASQVTAVFASVEGP